MMNPTTNTGISRARKSTDTLLQSVYAFPMSFAQQRLWFLNQFDTANPLYNIVWPMRLRGRLDVAALEESLNEIVRRHEVLRATFKTIDEQPVQVIAPSATITLQTSDLTALPEAEQQAEIDRVVTAETKTPISLETGPMLRTSFLRLGKEDHVLVLALHHIVSDRWSRAIFFRELAALYQAFSCGLPSPLPELPLQYTDFSVWQRGWLQGEALKKQLSYWTNRFANAPPLLELPTDRLRPAIESFHGNTLFKLLPVQLGERLKRLSQREGVTLFMTLLAAFDVLLLHYSGQEDLIVGSPIANRNRREVENLIGFFANTLVMRTDVSGNPTFRQLLARVREVALDAYAYQDLPFEKLVEELRLERSLSHNPLFQVMFALQNAPAEKIELPGLSLLLLPVSKGTSLFDLTLCIVESEQGLLMRLEYNTDLFDMSTISRLMERYQNLLETFIADPDERIGEVQLLSHSERKHLLVELNATLAAYPSNQCVHQLFEAQAQENPSTTAVVFQNQKLSYAQLNARANQLAHFLQQRGVGPDVLVGVCLERSLEMVVAVLAVMKAGGAYVPLDPAYPKERIAFILEDAKAPILLTQSSLLARLTLTSAQVVDLDSVQLAVAEVSSANPRNSATPSNLAHVIYTSGSTGKPKGVQIQHRSVVNLLYSIRREPGFTAKDVLLAVSTLCFDIAGLELFLPLTSGACVVIASREEAHDGRQLIRKLDSENITVMQATPATWRLLLESGWQGNPCLKIFCGGEVLVRELVDQLLPRCAELWNMYGPTETTVYSTVYRVREGESGSVPVGHPIANTEVYVLNAYGHPVPVGVAGELYIGGDGLAHGYLNRPQLTAEKFVPNPFSEKPGSRLYRTGDLVRYRSDDVIAFLGRIDNQIKLRGFRIELGEIESVLDAHDGVQQSVVVARDNSGEQQLVAYVIPDPSFRGAEQHGAGQHVKQWEAVWDQTYQQITPSTAANLDIMGRNSTYTGLPMAQDEMREWVDCTVERIRSLRPKHVLEIGCGTGLLLFRLARDCRHYHAADFSQNALNFVHHRLRNQPEKLPVTLLRRTADDFTGFEPESFDTIIINSVAQYFPSIHYFLEVLEKAVDAVRPEGAIFLGDIRSLPLLKAFHTAVQLQQAPASLPVKQLLDRVQRCVAQEEELVIDPAFFHALKLRLPRISGVEILLKGGRYHNEMTQFRYDVVLHVENEIPTRTASKWLDWDEQHLNLEQVRRIVKTTCPETLGIAGIPNGRVWEAVSALKLVETSGAPVTVGELRTRVRQASLESAVEPEDFSAMAADLCFSASLTWAGAGKDGRVNVLFRRKGTTVEVPSVVAEGTPVRPWAEYANDPIRGCAVQNLGRELRRWLNERLPDYMVPSVVVPLDSFPLLPNGKLDRHALPAPDAAGTRKAVPPRDDRERMLVQIWQKLLGVQPVGVTDNFFELGGHSLLAVRLISEIQKQTGELIPLASLFQRATIEQLANILRDGRRPSYQMVVAVQAQGSKPPFFGIVTPGANPLGYVALGRHMGKDQPFYEIQGPGAKLRRPYTPKEFEELAAEYIRGMKTIQPHGPYYLGGMCEGARIAFDMARLLEAEGERVGLLAILDTWVLENSQNRILWKIDYYAGRVKWFWRVSRADKWRALQQWAKNRYGSSHPERLWPKAYWPGKDWVSANYSGKITVFKIPKQPFFYINDRLLGWGTRTTGQVELQLIESKHLALLREPYVRQLAPKLLDCLSRAQAQYYNLVPEDSELATTPEPSEAYS